MDPEIKNTTQSSNVLEGQKYQRPQLLPDIFERDTEAALLDCEKYLAISEAGNEKIKADNAKRDSVNRFNIFYQSCKKKETIKASQAYLLDIILGNDKGAGFVETAKKLDVNQLTELASKLLALCDFAQNADLNTICESILGFIVNIPKDPLSIDETGLHNISDSSYDHIAGEKLGDLVTLGDCKGAVTPAGYSENASLSPFFNIANSAESPRAQQVQDLEVGISFDNMDKNVDDDLAVSDISDYGSDCDISSDTEIDYDESPRKQLDQSLDGKEKEDPINIKELFSTDLGGVIAAIADLKENESSYDIVKFWQEINKLNDIFLVKTCCDRIDDPTKLKDKLADMKSKLTNATTCDVIDEYGSYREKKAGPEALAKAAESPTSWSAMVAYDEYKPESLWRL
ncbi:MAG: hypothetical protein HOM96_04235 [Rickettsiales bacterium]|nr:hypothetical protein [Rickettsiales bacterium]